MPLFSDHLYSALGAPSLDSINFLSEVNDRYPRANIEEGLGRLAEFRRNLPRQDAQP
jgi:hypothetical protein